jgi:hypothetical protein
MQKARRDQHFDGKGGEEHFFHTHKVKTTPTPFFATPAEEASEVNADTPSLREYASEMVSLGKSIFDEGRVLVRENSVRDLATAAVDYALTETKLGRKILKSAGEVLLPKKTRPAKRARKAPTKRRKPAAKAKTSAAATRKRRTVVHH